MPYKSSLFSIFCLVFLAIYSLNAKVTHLEILSRSVYQNGKKFGKIGTYEELKGKIYFEIDPLAATNQAVIDVHLAKRNKNGLVPFSADIILLLPTDRSKINGTLIYEFNNRGELFLPYLDSPAYPLFSRGFVFVSTGWIGELLPIKNKLRLCVPIAYKNGKEIKGKVRIEVIGQKGKQRLNINGIGHGGYEPTGKGYKMATLTKRMRATDPRTIIASSSFFLETNWSDYTCKPDGLPKVELVMEDGFEANYIYELIYEAKNPIIQGLGFAGIRDVISFLHFKKEEKNPLMDWNKKPFIQHTIGFGNSQSGRALRMFLYEGFNEDEQGRQVFDGGISQTAGAGMGFFNHRFASPTRNSFQRENHLFPTDIFPFSYSHETDPITGKTDGILRRARSKKVLPKIMHIQSSAEYWHRCASLVHTNPMGDKDAIIPDNVRIYSIIGQHGSGDGIPKKMKAGNLAQNHADYSPFIRTFIIAMNDWITKDETPPPSVYPKLSDSTLCDYKKSVINWKSIPYINYPEVINQAYLADFGKDFSTSKYISQHPPIIEKNYPIFVPQLDADNNELGMLKMPAIALPTGTYTGWNLRAEEMGSVGDLLSLTGGYIPFAITKKERIKNQDFRLSIKERYKNFTTYFDAYKAATLALVQQGYLLEEEVYGVLELAKKNRKLIE